MNRRALLTALSSSPLLLAAGCTSTQSCDAVEIVEASVSVENQCDDGETGTGVIEGRADDCSSELTLEILDDGETIEEQSFEATDGQWSVEFGEGPGQLRTIPSQGDKRVQVRGPDDEVRAEGTLDVSHYRESPDLGCPSGGSCGAVEIVEASVSVEYQCDTGEARTGVIEGRADDCSSELTLEILDEGETIEERSFEATDGQWSVGFGEGPGQLRSIPSQGDKRVQVRGPDDEVRAEGTLDVSHYLDSPDLDVWRPQFEPEEVSVGEPVTVTFSVATFGAGTSFTAALLVGDEAVATREGTVDGGTDCQDASGPAYEFAHTFDEPGAYELRGRVTVDGSSDGGDTRSIGTVTVTE